MKDTLDERILNELWDVVDFMEGFSDDAQFMGDTFEDGYTRFKEKQVMVFRVDEMGIENITSDMRDEMIDMVRDGLDFMEGFSGHDDPFEEVDEDFISIDERIERKFDLLREIRLNS